MDMHCLGGIDVVATVPREGWACAARGRILNLIHHGKNGIVNNAVWVVPRPESPALLKVIKSLAAGARAEYAAHPTTSKYDRVESTWGPKASSIAIAQHPDENIVLLHGLEEPSFSGELSSCNASSALCHVHEGSWLDNKLKASRPVSMFIESYTQRPLVAELVLGAVLGGVLGACVGRAGRKLRRKTQRCRPRVHRLCKLLADAVHIHSHTHGRPAHLHSPGAGTAAAPPHAACAPASSYTLHAGC